MALTEFDSLMRKVMHPEPRPTITVHRPWDGTYRNGPLPEHFDTVAEASRFARRNGATIHAAGEPCDYCDKAVEA